jgi:hypothetical protein
MVAPHQCTRRVDDGDARWLQTLGRQDELGVDERCDGEEEMAGDKKLSGSWDVVAGAATGSTMVVAWVGVSFGPTQGGGGSV